MLTTMKDVSVEDRCRSHKRDRATAGFRPGTRFAEYGVLRSVYRAPSHVKLKVCKRDICLDTFLAKFENRSRYLQWIETHRLFNLQTTLDEPAD